MGFESRCFAHGRSTQWGIVPLILESLGLHLRTRFTCHFTIIHRYFEKGIKDNLKRGGCSCLHFATVICERIKVGNTYVVQRTWSPTVLTFLLGIVKYKVYLT